MTGDALVVFGREPLPERVKTRLGKDIGAEAACRVYRELLRLSLAAAREIDAARFVYLPERERLDFQLSGFETGLQVGDDLGRRMMAAFTECFGLGFQRVVLMGSDCPGLTAPVIQQAFDALQKVEAVFGPSRDGGYYLVGQRPPGRDLFSGIPWSSRDVWPLTRQRLENRGWSYSTVETLEDVDDLGSLRRCQSETGETLGFDDK